MLLLSGIGEIDASIEPSPLELLKINGAQKKKKNLQKELLGEASYFTLREVRNYL